MLTTQPAIHWIRRANEWENKLLRAEWYVMCCDGMGWVGHDVTSLSIQLTLYLSIRLITFSTIAKSLILSHPYSCSYTRLSRCVTSMQDAVDHETQRQLDRLKPKPPPFSNQVSHQTAHTSHPRWRKTPHITHNTTQKTSHNTTQKTSHNTPEGSKNREDRALPL